MRNKKTILAAVVASVVASASSHAKLGGAYVGLNGVNVFADTFENVALGGRSAMGNMSMNTLGFGIEAGYNWNFSDILIGGGLSYIYAEPSYGYVSDTDTAATGSRVKITSIDQDISGHRINLDLNAGYVLENKVTLNVGAVLSWNPREPKYTIPSFNKKTTNDFGLGLKVGTDIKLTECMSFNISYRMTWFDTTQDYKDFVEKNKAGLGGDDAMEVSKLKRVDKMITAGIRFNF